MMTELWPFVRLTEMVTNSTFFDWPADSLWMTAQCEYSDRLFWSLRGKMHVFSQRIINDEEAKPDRRPQDKFRMSC